MYIGGVGVARGYLNLPELTKERFVTDPFSNEPNARMYNSGDLAKYLPDGNIELLGRNDEQIKIRGFRIEPAEIEAALTDHFTVNQAAVIAKEDSKGNNRLIAYFVLKKGVKLSDVEKFKAFYKAFLMKSLPEYMVPSAFIPLPDRLPLSPNGKLDRKALPDLQSNVLSCTCEPPQNDTEIILTKLWKQLLDVENISRQDNFFMLGGDSIQAVTFALQISKHFNHQFPVQVLYNYPILSSLAQYIDLQKGNYNTLEDLELLLLDKTLPENIQPIPRPLEPWCKNGRVFITGVTGFLGAFVLRDLLLMPGVKSIVCLVRATNNEHAFSRIKDNMLSYGIWQDSFSNQNCILALAGDLGLNYLGLEKERFIELSENIDVVFHLGMFTK